VARSNDEMHRYTLQHRKLLSKEFCLPLGVTANLTNRAVDRTRIVIVILHVALFVASLVVVPVLVPGANIPNRFGSDEAGRAFLLRSSEAIRVSSWLQLLSAVCLAALGAMLTARHKTVGETSASALTTVGSIGSAESVIACVLLIGWVLTMVRPSWAVRSTLGAQSFATFGTMVGIFTIVVGVGPRTMPDIVYHACILTLLSGLSFSIYLWKGEGNSKRKS